MCEQGKFSLHFRPSLGQMGKQFHAGAVKPEPGFCGSGFGFFQSVRCPIRWTKVTDALGTRLAEKGTYVFMWNIALQMLGSIAVFQVGREDFEGEDTSVVVRAVLALTKQTAKID